MGCQNFDKQYVILDCWCLYFDWIEGHSHRIQLIQIILNLSLYTFCRASDRLRQKKGNFVAFSREIMRQKRSIMLACKLCDFFKADLTLLY